MSLLYTGINAGLLHAGQALALLLSASLHSMLADAVEIGS